MEHYCPTIGNICMDMAMIDITNVQAQEGDEVIIFGENPDISTIARQTGTIPYEILTGISERVNRVFYKE
jgi:alanine racemase